MDRSEAPADLTPQPGQSTEPRSGRDMRAIILETAATLFAERGYNATSVREVVAAAGCTKPTLYYYFKNKEQLFLEVIRDCIEQLTRDMEEKLAEPGSLRQKLHSALSTNLELFRKHPTMLRLVMTAERHPEDGQPAFDFAGLREYHVGLIRKMLLDGIDTGQLRDDFDVNEAALALFGTVDHRLVLHLHGRELPPDYADQVLDLFFRGVGR